MGTPQQNYIIGGVGRLCRQKQWRVLIEAAAEVFRHRDDVTFLIAGEGEERASLERAIRKRHLEGKVRLLGHVSDVSKTYSCLDVFVSTSLWEGLPYAYLEADCFGLPMILPPSSLSDRLFQGILPLFSSGGQLCFCESIAFATGGDVCEREKTGENCKNVTTGQRGVQPVCQRSPAIVSGVGGTYLKCLKI
ncbi:MAG: glycosyltransferase [Alistipes indistinctus]